MGRIIAFLKRVRIQWRRSPKTEKVLVYAIGLCVVALLVLGLTVADARARAEALKAEAARLEQENAKLEEYIEGLGSADSVGQIAKDELGLVDPDTTIVVPEEE